MISLRLLQTVFVTLVLLLPPTLSFADTTADQTARLKALRAEVEALKDQKTPDTIYHADTGLGGAKEVGKKFGSQFGKELADIDLIGSVAATQEAKVKKRLQKRTKQLTLRNENIKRIEAKNRKYAALEKTLLKDEKKAQKQLKKINKNRVRQHSQRGDQLKVEAKRQRHKIKTAKFKGQKIREKKIKLKHSKNLSQQAKLNRSIARDKKRLAAFKRSAQRKIRFDDSGFLIGTVLSAISAEVEENAQAEREGRKPLAINKLINFSKNVTGYAAIEGAYTNIKTAELEAYIKTLEYYQLLGLDYKITDPYVQKKAAEAMRSAVIRNTVYEGAKLAPIAGEMIAIKEGMDAAGNAYVASEEAAYITENNEQVQFQISLRAAMKAEATITRLEKLAKQSKLLLSSLGKLHKQLLTMEKDATTSQQQLKAAINILEAYSQQAASLNNPATLSSLKSENITLLLNRLSKVKSAVEEQKQNIQRVISEHQGGALTAQAVATQGKFIGDLLQPSINDYQNLRQTVQTFEALSLGSDLREQVPAALETTKQAKLLLQQQSRISSKLYAIYQDQAAVLENVSKDHQQTRQQMTKYRQYVTNSKHLEDHHRHRIRAALERLDNNSIDHRSISNAMHNARRLHNSNDMVKTLARLDKSPQPVDTAKIDSLTQLAEKAWAKLAKPNNATAESVNQAQQLLAELIALAGEAKPVELETVAEKENLAGKGGRLLTGKPILAWNEYEISDIFNNHKNGKFIRENFLGFTAFDYDNSSTSVKECGNSNDFFCPRSKSTTFKIVETGQTTRRNGSRQGQVPYWIVFQLYGISTYFHQHHQIGRPLVEESSVKNRLKEQDTQLIKLSLKNADESIVVAEDNRNHLYANKGPVQLSTSSSILCVAGGVRDGDEKTGYSIYQQRGFNGEDAIKRPESLEKEYGRKFIRSCADWQENQEKILQPLAGHLLTEIAPWLTKVRDNFHLADVKINLHLPGFTTDSSGKGVTRNWIVKSEDKEEECHEIYNFSILNSQASGRKSWQQIMDEMDEKIDTTKESYPEIGVNISGADHARAWQYYSYNDYYKLAPHRFSDRIKFRIRNILVSVSGSIKSDQKQSRTQEVANAIAAQILNNPTGW